MNPFATTPAEVVTYNMAKVFFPLLKQVTLLQEQLAQEYDVNAIAADFTAVEAAGGADVGTPVNYGGYDSRDVWRWAAVTDAFEDLLAQSVTVTFADATTETLTIKTLILRHYLPFQG